MGFFARVAGCAAMLGLVACAAIAGLEAPPELEVTDGTKPPPDPTGSSTNSPPPQQPQNADATASNPDAAPVGDSGKADADATAPCDKTANGLSCLDGNACCSTKCNEAKVCAADCRSGGSSCDPFASAPCCIGFYCSVAVCAPCIGPGGNPMDLIGGGKNAKSCCSRVIVANGTCQ